MYSALIPNGRSQAMLHLCLTNILTQTVKPTEIIMFDDNTDSDFNKSTLKMADYMGIQVKILRNVKCISEFTIREWLIAEASKSNPYCLFVDDDVILESDAADFLLAPLLIKQKTKVAFTQGLRLEVGGREQNSDDDINQVKIGTKSGIPIYYGDTSMLMINRQIFHEELPWDALRPFIDKANTAGTDVVMTMSIVDQGYIGMAIPEAIGYHFASANFSYWNGFTAADRYIRKSCKGIISEELLEKVYGGRG